MNHHQTSFTGRTKAVAFSAGVVVIALALVALLMPGLVMFESLLGFLLFCLLLGEAIASRDARTIAVGFGVTVTIWAIAYLAMMQPGLVVGEFLFGLVLLCLVAGGSVAGRDAQRHGQNQIFAGAKIGLFAATLNLMIVGSLLVDPETRQMHREAPLWIAGNFVVSILLSAIGGWFGTWNIRRSATSATASVIKDKPTRNWYQHFLSVAAMAIFLLLITGGLVTGMQAGLAVPDWPESFGHNMLLYPLAEMRGGVFYEHAHRLYGMLVGVTAIAVAVTMFFFDRRGWMHVLGVALLLGVITQGILGGTRVTENNLPLAIIHGVFAQVLFATVVCMAALASTTWKSELPRTYKIGAKTDYNFSIALIVLMILQIGLGALYRHMHRAGGNPPEPLHPLLTHIVVALIVTILAIIVGGRAWGTHREQPVLPTIGGTLLLLIGGQLVLGTLATIAVWMSNPVTEATPPPMLELVVTTAHQVTGALLLASSALIMVWTRRLLTPRAA